MSWQALAWAAKAKAGSLANKAVLLALANVADEHGLSHPSTAYLAEVVECDSKTITAALDRLTAGGLIAETGGRAGKTMQVKVYRLSMTETPPETEGFQKRKASAFSAKDPQKRGTEPSSEPLPPTEASPLPVERARKLRPPAARPKPAHGCRLPSDWRLPALPVDLTLALESWPPGKLEREERKFRDYWAAKAGAGGRKADWDATWRNWLWKADEDLAKNGQSPRTTRHPFEKPSGWSAAIADGFAGAR